MAVFVVRDTADDFINVTAWINEEFSKHLDDDYHIGDIVEIGQPKIDLKSPMAHEDP